MAKELPGPAKPEAKAEAKPVTKPESKPEKTVKKSQAPKKAKSGLLLKTVDLDLYRCFVQFAIRKANDDVAGFTTEDASAFYEFLGGNSREEVDMDIADTAGFQQGYHNHFIVGMLVYTSRGDTFPRVMLSTIAHEADHCATAITRWLGMSVEDVSGNETHAHVTGYLTRHLYKFLVANNVFIDNGG